MSEWTPTRKVSAGMAGGALATLAVVVLDMAGYPVGQYPGAETAIGVLSTIAFAYFVKEGE